MLWSIEERVDCTFGVGPGLAEFLGVVAVFCDGWSDADGLSLVDRPLPLDELLG